MHLKPRGLKRNSAGKRGKPIPSYLLTWKDLKDRQRQSDLCMYNSEAGTAVTEGYLQCPLCCPNHFQVHSPVHDWLETV